MLQRRLAPLAAFLLASILLAAPAALGQERLTLEAIHASPKYGGASFQGGRWASEGPVVLYVDAKADGTTDLVSYNLETDARETLIEGANLQAADAGKRIGIEEYAYSGDGSKVLLFADTSPVWRNNTQGFYYVYDRAARRLAPVSDRAKGTQLFAKFNPAGTHVGFVRGRNVYVRDLATGQERALTTDGADGAVINGTTDWVYEEEFGLRDAWQWSPDGRHIAFLKLDEAKENTFEMADNRGFYPEVTRFKYPKAGSPNAEIQLGVADVSTGVVTYFDTDTWYKGGDAHEYLPQFGWTPEVGGRRQVWLFRMNRDQNVLDLMYADPSNGTVRTVLTERSPSWLEVETGFTDLTGGNLTYLADNLHFIWVSERDGYRHLYLYRNDGTLVRQLTDGDWDVTGFLGADEGLGLLYFVAAKESPVERHVYRQAVSFAGEAAAPARGRRGRARGATTGATTIAEPTRITQESGWHSAELSRDRRYFIDTY